MRWRRRPITIVLGLVVLVVVSSALARVPAVADSGPPRAVLPAWVPPIVGLGTSVPMFIGDGQLTTRGVAEGLDPRSVEITNYGDAQRFLKLSVAMDDAIF